jgi:hypothetical protein
LTESTAPSAGEVMSAERAAQGLRVIRRTAESESPPLSVTVRTTV